MPPVSSIVVVVGAGVAGLRVARELRRRGATNVMVLEASRRSGGRVRSRHDGAPPQRGGGRLLYETGPWRIPETHIRAIALCRDLGVRLERLPTPTLAAAEPPPATTPGLTTWEARALETADPLSADLSDLRTGYADETHSASGSAPYHSDAAAYYVAPDGFDAIVSGLQGDTDVRYDHRVVDALRRPDGGYRLRVLRRTGSNGFARHDLDCDALFVCVPPHVCRGWSILDAYARSVLCAVEPGALHHVYAHGRHPPGRHERHARSLLAQTVSSAYGNGWFQASYSGGRLAWLWHHLRMLSPTRFRDRIVHELGRLDAAWSEHVTDVSSHFWPVAFHVWRAVPDFDLERAVRTAVRPNPEALRDVYLAGEAFSSYQAWMEGALETADRAVAEFFTPLPPATPLPDRYVVVEGRVLDVDRWIARHPGGEGPLRNHLAEDVTDLMRHFLHSDHAWAVVHSLKE